MTLLQLWLFVGIPAIALGGAMFVGHSWWRSLLGYLCLLIGFAVMVPFHRPSAAIFGVLLALVYAAGRGGDVEREYDHVSATGVGAADAAEALRHGDDPSNAEDEATPAAT